MGMSIFEKLSIIFELFTHSPFALLALIFCIFLVLSLLINLYVDKKYIKAIFPIIYTIFIVILLFNYRSNMVKGFSLFIDDLFFKTYFPSIALYFMLLFINAIVLFISMFIKKIEQYSKIMNIISFSLLQLLFALFFYTITEQNLVISDWEKLYQNQTVLSILEVSMGIFLIWVFLLIIGFALHMINKKWGEPEDELVIPYEAWQRLETLVKGNLLKLSEEVEKVKQQSEHDRKYMLEHFELLENKLEQTSQYLLSELQETTENIQSRSMRQELSELKDYVEQNQKLIVTEIEQLRATPFKDIDDLKTRLSLLEDIVSETNEKMLLQVSFLKETPTYEINKLKDQINELERLLKRYMVDMNYQLVQTRKELQDVSFEKRARTREF